MQTLSEYHRGLVGGLVAFIALILLSQEGLGLRWDCDLLWRSQTLVLAPTPELFGSESAAVCGAVGWFRNDKKDRNVFPLASRRATRASLAGGCHCATFFK